MAVTACPYFRAVHRARRFEATLWKTGIHWPRLGPTVDEGRRNSPHTPKELCHPTTAFFCCEEGLCSEDRDRRFAPRRSSSNHSFGRGGRDPHCLLRWRTRLLSYLFALRCGPRNCRERYSGHRRSRPSACSGRRSLRTRLDGYVSDTGRLSKGVGLPIRRPG